MRAGVDGRWWHVDDLSGGDGVPVGDDEDAAEIPLLTVEDEDAEAVRVVNVVQSKENRLEAVELRAET